MERIGHLGGPGHHGIEDGSVGARDVQGCPLHPSTRVQTLVTEPLHRASGTSTRDEVEELARFDVGDRGVKLAPAIDASPHEEHLVESEGTYVLEASGHVEERLAVTVDPVIERVPVTDDLGHPACAWRPTRQAGDNPKLAWPEFDSFARVEDASCLKNWLVNLSPNKRGSICRRRRSNRSGYEAGLRASLMTCYPTYDRNGVP